MPVLDDPAPLVIQIVHPHPSRTESVLVAEKETGETVVTSKAMAAEQEVGDTDHRVSPTSQKFTTRDTWRFQANELVEPDLGVGSASEKASGGWAAPEEDPRQLCGDDPKGGDPDGVSADEKEREISDGTHLGSVSPLFLEDSIAAEGTHLKFDDTVGFVQIDLSDLASLDSERTVSDVRELVPPGEPCTPRARVSTPDLFE
jgi:hypothetical protein